VEVEDGDGVICSSSSPRPRPGSGEKTTLNCGEISSFGVVIGITSLGWWPCDWI